MRLSISIAALAFCLALHTPIWAQGSTNDSDANSYRDQLRAASTDQDRPNSAQSDETSARQAYKDQLRRLAGGGTGNYAASRAIASPSSTANAAPPKQSSMASQPIAKSAVQPVSMQRDEQKTTPTVSDAVACQGENSSSSDSSEGGSSSSACTDPYCERLKQIADGKEPLTSSLVGNRRTLTTERTFVKNIAFDQMQIWESPFKLRDYDATWAVPFGILTGSLIDTDRDLSKQLAKPSRRNISDQISNAGLFGSIGVGAGFYGLGLMTHDDHKRETGLLSGEAFINATLVAEALKLAVGRQRPFQGDGFGHIGKGGSSFPSEHAIGTFAIASVIAREYPNPFVEIGSYGVAAAVAAARVTAGQHFSSDVLVGGTLGYLIGRKIYNDHHNPELDGAQYGTFVHEHNYDAEDSGSAYVELDSWVYPVIDRLAALGYVHSNFDSERPWTRLECARLAVEAAEATQEADVPADVRRMVDSLSQEFSRETTVWAGGSANHSVELESIYSRVTGISGPPLRDGFHFGQTIFNDYGRPFARGFNDITGFSARSTSGPFVLYFRGEYQHAPATPNYNAEQRAAITSFDGTPQLDNPFPAEDRFRVLDAYLGFTLAGNEITLGQQSLWWGPGTGGPFMFTNNAEPLKMIRLNNTSPVSIPFFSKFLGPLHYDVFLGQLDGHHFIHSEAGVKGGNFVLFGPILSTQPFIQGQRFSFKPTENFEFGFTRTGIFGGTSIPFTFDELIKATFSLGTTTAPGTPDDPGDRRSGVDVTYRVPGLRNSLMLYIDEFADDELSPLFVPRRSAMHAGIYMPKLPKLHNVDLRVEGIYTDVPNLPNTGLFYTNLEYRNGFTNDGNLMGSWIGPQGRGIFATSKVWLTARSSVQLGYRGAQTDVYMQGGRYQDFTLLTNFQISRDIAISTNFQYEAWRFSLLANGPQRDFVSSIGFMYMPVRRPHWSTTN